MEKKENRGGRPAQIKISGGLKSKAKVVFNGASSPITEINHLN